MTRLSIDEPNGGERPQESPSVGYNWRPSEARWAITATKDAKASKNSLSTHNLIVRRWSAEAKIAAVLVVRRARWLPLSWSCCLRLVQPFVCRRLSTPTTRQNFEVAKRSRQRSLDAVGDSQGWLLLALTNGVSSHVATKDEASPEAAAINSSAGCVGAKCERMRIEGN